MIHCYISHHRSTEQFTENARERKHSLQCVAVLSSFHRLDLDAKIWNNINPSHQPAIMNLQSVQCSLQMTCTPWFWALLPRPIDNYGKKPTQKRAEQCASYKRVLFRKSPTALLQNTILLHLWSTYSCTSTSWLDAISHRWGTATYRRWHDPRRYVCNTNKEHEDARCHMERVIDCWNRIREAINRCNTRFGGHL